jgi:hypothetical protein
MVYPFIKPDSGFIARDKIFNRLFFLQLLLLLPTALSRSPYILPGIALYLTMLAARSLPQFALPVKNSWPNFKLLAFGFTRTTRIYNGKLDRQRSIELYRVR